MKSDEWYKPIEGEENQIDNLIQIGTKDLLVKGIHFSCQVYRDIATNEFAIWGTNGKQAGQGELILSFRLEPAYIEQSSLTAEKLWSDISERIEHDFVTA